MTLKSVIDIVAATLELTKKEAATAVEVVAGAINTVASSGSPVRVPPLGSFTKKHKIARTGRNPQTGEAIQIAAKDVLTFKASAAK